MRKRLWILPVGFVGVLVVGLVAFLSSAPDTKLPAAADASLPGAVVESPGNPWSAPDTNLPAAADVSLPGAGAESPDNPVVSPQDVEGVGFDPLYPQEQARAEAMVLADPRVKEQTENVRHAVLMVENRIESKNNLGPRRADVFIYVYPANRLLHGVANLGSNVVEDVTVTQGWQPLITADEASLALITALADADAGRLIREQYQQITGSALRQPDQLRVTAGVYYGADMPIPTARVCGIQRCAQLLLAVPDGAALNVTPIINLSSERVVYLGQ